MKKVLSIIAAAALLAVSCGQNNKTADTGGVKTFGVSPIDDIAFPAKGGSETINIESNVSWTATSDNDYFSVKPSSGKGNGSVVIKADAYTGATAQSGTVGLIPDEVEGPALTTVYINISQAATSEGSHED